MYIVHGEEYIIAILSAKKIDRYIRNVAERYSTFFLKGVVLLLSLFILPELEVNS